MKKNLEHFLSVSRYLEGIMWRQGMCANQNIVPDFKMICSLTIYYGSDPYVIICKGRLPTQNQMKFWKSSKLG